MSQQVGIPKGTRDFSPGVMRRRNYIFGVIREAFEKFGFQPLETPSMENLSTLTGKYGDEGDQLIFKILNNGDFLKDVKEDTLTDSKKLSFQICDRALRYDLTVPFARFVAMNRNELAFPFRRYQIQPVWRADRPQKGRFREFYQCDADIVGTESLWSEIELIQLFDQVLSKLYIPKFEVKINNRKILYGLAEVTKCVDQFTALTVVLDKLDKIGLDAVQKELNDLGISSDVTRIISEFSSYVTIHEQLEYLSQTLATSETGKKGVEELAFLFQNLQGKIEHAILSLDLTLARGLNYYTGAIFEVKALDVQMGSICGGGRYDNLTGVFGLPNVSGVGISFGADRIYEVMSELNLFPEGIDSGARVAIVHFGGETQFAAFNLSHELRLQGIQAVFYPDDAKIKKQMKYANDLGAEYVVVIGEDELAKQTWQVKHMKSGEQFECTTQRIIQLLTGSM
jgi:histidyl-tRNA synthetase